MRFESPHLMGISPLRAGFFAVFGLCLPASAAVTVGSDQPFGSGNYRSTQVHATVDLSENYISRLRIPNTGRITPAAPVAALGAPRFRRACWAGGLGQPSAEGRRVPAQFVRRGLSYFLVPQDETFGWGLTGAGSASRSPHHAFRRVLGGGPGSAAGVRPDRPGGDFSIGQTDFGVFGTVKFRHAWLSGGLTKSHYDKTLDLGDARVIQALELSGLEDRAGLPIWAGT